MNTSHTTFRIPPTTVPSEEDASWLRRHTHCNLYDEQPERFEPSSAVDWVRVTEPVFTCGTMAWLDEVEDALLLIDSEQSRGHVAVLLEDLDFGLWVVVSSRRFRDAAAADVVGPRGRRPGRGSGPGQPVGPAALGGLTAR